MTWKRVSRDTVAKDGYYVTRSKSGHGWYYNGWKGDYNDRDLREHIDAGWNAEEVKAACERHSEGK